MKITWLGQAGFLLEKNGKKILLDPYLSDAVERIAGRERMVAPPFPPEALKCDAVVCSHNHLDHLDIDAIPLMSKEHTVFLAPTHARDTLMSCGVTRYLPFDTGESYEIGDLKLTAVFADHTVPAVGILLEYRGLKLYFSGDTEYHPRLCELAGEGIDLMLVCINGRLGNMNAEEAARLTEILSPRVGIPTHYGMFRSNTEDPQRYLSRIPHGFEMKYNIEYSVKEILNGV